MDFTKVPCENLPTLEFGEYVTSIAKGAFTEYNAVRTVISHNPVPPTSEDADIFSPRTYLEGELYVPEASIQAYQAANGWNLFGVVKAIPDSSVALVTTIQLDETEVTLNVGETLQLNVVVYPDSADNKTLQWTSSDNSVATVDETGMVSAVSQGSATITVQTTDGSNISQTCLVHVSNSTGISSVATGDAFISVSVKHGVVYVSGKEPNDEVSVYTMSGTLLVKTKDNVIPLSQSGAFVVRVKQIAQKIVL
jgi:uncharacterized protein YjdB